MVALPVIAWKRKAEDESSVLAWATLWIWGQPGVHSETVSEKKNHLWMFYNQKLSYEVSDHLAAYICSAHAHTHVSIKQEENVTK